MQSLEANAGRCILKADITGNGTNRFEYRFRKGSKISGKIRVIGQVGDRGICGVRLEIRQFRVREEKVMYRSPLLRSGDEFQVNFTVPEDGVYAVYVMTDAYKDLDELSYYEWEEVLYDYVCYDVELYYNERESATSHRLCSNCGVEVSSIDNFCWFCGKKLE